MSVLSKLRYPLYPLYEARLKRELRGKKAKIKEKRETTPAS